MVETLTMGLAGVLVATVGGVSLYTLLAYLVWAVVFWRGCHGQELRPYPLRAAVREWWAILRVIVASLRSRWWPLLHLHAGTPGGIPVLCLHGYLMDAGNFRWMAPHLAAAGCGAVYAMNLRGLFRTLEEYAHQFSAVICRVRELTGAEEVDVVCHSMGGLVVRVALARGGCTSGIRRVVTLGTPAFGTLLARLGRGANARQMRPGSKLLTSLPTVPESFTAIWSSTDAMVLPCTAARTGGREVVIHDEGHLSLLFSSRAVRAVIESLTAPATSVGMEPARKVPQDQDVTP